VLSFTQSTLSTKIYPAISANATLVLLAVANSLLDRQVARLATDFENEGGFTERLYSDKNSKKK
jgi:four helix bundle suffix protein